MFAVLVGYGPMTVSTFSPALVAAWVVVAVLSVLALSAVSVDAWRLARLSRKARLAIAACLSAFVLVCYGDAHFFLGWFVWW